MPPLQPVQAWWLPPTAISPQLPLSAPPKTVASQVSYALKQAALAAAAEAANGSSSRKRARGANGAPAAAAPSGSEGEAAPACVILEKSSPVTLAKSVKNAAELAGLREAHLRDGAALARFLCWLDKTIASGGLAGGGGVLGQTWGAPCAGMPQAHAHQVGAPPVLPFPLLLGAPPPV